MIALAAGGEGLDPNSVTPGLIGFLATFALVLVSILLFVNMSSRLRRMQRREDREAERREAERRAAEPQRASEEDGSRHESRE